MSFLSDVLSFPWFNGTQGPSTMDNANRDEPSNADQDEPSNADRDKPSNADRDETSNAGRGEPFNADREVISSATSGEEVISALAHRGCTDLTTEINLEACSDLPLAGGGFCNVYRGSLNDGAKIAIKSLRLYDQPGGSNEKGKILKRAARELYYWSKMKHPNVLPLMGLAMFRGHLSMISEWMENGNLVEYLNLNPSMDRVGLCVNVCAGLSYIHDNDVVHGNLKAANIMVSHNGIVMITDFGNSQLRDLTLRFTNTTSSSFSIRWAAPELLLNEAAGCHVSKKSDVYAYGMTVLEILTDKIPFEELSERKVLSLVALKRHTPARPVKGVSSEMWKILNRCWKWEDSARPDMRTIELLLRDVYFQAWVEAREQDGLNMGHPKDIQINESAMPEMGLKGASGSADSGYQRRLQGLSGLAMEYLTQGQLEKAGILAAEVLAVQKRVLGADHINTLQRVLHTETLAARKRVLGADHPNTLQSMHHLAATHEKQGRLAEAESLYAETLAARKRVLGADHPDTLRSMHHLAVTREKQDRLAEAGPLYSEVLAIRKRVLGAGHPDTLQSMHHLAVTHGKQGRMAESKALYGETLQSMSSLAVTREKQGRLAEAESLYIKALAALKRVLGVDHPETLQSTHSMALKYEQQGRLAEAEALYVETLATRRRVLGADHPATMQSMYSLAVTQEKQGRLAEAEVLYVETLTTRKRVLGANHPETLQTMYNLVVTYYKQGRLAEAESLNVEALAARKRVLAPGHPGMPANM